MTGHLDQRGFGITVPEGFIELPAEVDQEGFDRLQEVVAQRFGLAAGAEVTEQAALGFATMGALAAQQLAGFVAVAVYRSPDDAERLIMVWLTVTEMPSAHESPEVAVQGLVEAHRARGLSEPNKVRLTAGPAVVTVTEEPMLLHVGEQSAPVLRREVTAWAPDPFGTRVAVLSLATNSWPDWAHVCGLALGVFDSLDWAPASTGEEARLGAHP
ncbi:hypothetical protein M8C13_03745 [Crossiella sp. SN42]|uniref:hypothetical protein n=1 Tax=Crossiella sp. SN42 TaxID=2944808 RepID=UPI00207C304D|nr:hypothetical protein [Crossiella sp. SN42]MCO1574872.1 hypothetical protein [Crossiella sp. SN42]